MAHHGGDEAMTAAQAEPSDARSLLDRFIAEQVEFEEDRRQSIQAPGTTVLTASGGLVTLILTISPIAVPAFKAGAALPLMFRIGLSLFGLGAVFSILTIVPLPARVVPWKGVAPEVPHAPGSLTAYRRGRLTVATKQWGQLLALPEGDVEAGVRSIRVGLVVGMHRLNHAKNACLAAALVSDVAGLTLIAWSIAASFSRA